MRRLGYDRYVAQGGDVGALVTDLMGRQGVEGLAGYHLNLLTAVLAIGDHLPKESDQEQAAAEAVATFKEDGFGYFLEMATRPQTISYGTAGFTGRAGGLAARSRHRQLLQDRRRLRRRKAHGQPDAGADPRQHHAVLAHRHRGLGGPVVLGGRTSAGRSACERPASSAGHRAGRLHDVPRRDLGDRRAVGPRRSTPASPTSTRSTRAATSPPGRSPACSPTRSARCSGRSASGRIRKPARPDPHAAARRGDRVAQL